MTTTTFEARPRRITSTLLWTGQILMAVFFLFVAVPGKLVGSVILFTHYLPVGSGLFEINPDGSGETQIPTPGLATVQAAAAGSQPLCKTTGTTLDDTISTGSLADVICAEDGSDSISANDGADTIFAGSGDDSVNGGNGNDVLVGGAGNDVLNGGAGSNWINASDGVSGNDHISGDSSDICIGDPGDIVTGCTLRPPP